MKIIYVEIEKLKPYNNNPRINTESVKYVKKSIQEFGFKVPMIITKDYKIITGHTRYKASLELKLKTVPCIIADDLDEKQIDLFRIVDNKVSEYSEWNYELLDKEIDELMDIDMEEFGFSELDDNLDFIDDLLGSGIAGDEFDVGTTVISIKFPKDDEEMIKNVIKKHGKQKILDEVYKRVDD